MQGKSGVGGVGGRLVDSVVADWGFSQLLQGQPTVVPVQ